VAAVLRRGLQGKFNHSQPARATANCRSGDGASAHKPAVQRNNF